MKTPRHLLTVAAALSASLAFAADPPDQPTPPPRDGADRPVGPGANRPDGPRPEDARPEGRRPEAPRPERAPGEERRPNLDGPAAGNNRRDNPQPGADRPGYRAEGPASENRRPLRGPDGNGLQRPQLDRPAVRMFQEQMKAANPPTPPKPQAFLGVVSGPLEPTLSAQLGLTEGVGLVVMDMLPDSPAAKAGLQKYDVLKQINDQFIINPAQLSTLVKHYGKDTDVALTIVRKGQEQKLTAKIGERVMPEPHPFRAMIRVEEGPGGYNPPRPNDPNGAQPRRPGAERGPEALPPGGPNNPPAPPQPGRPPRTSADILREVGPGGAPEVHLFRDQINTTWMTANARLALKDGDGGIEVLTEKGQRTMIVKNANGETVFNGPIDTDEQRQAVPEPFHKKLEKIDRLTSVGRRAPQPEAGQAQADAAFLSDLPAEFTLPTPPAPEPEVQ